MFGKTLKSISIALFLIILTSAAQIQAQTCTTVPVGLVAAYSGDGNALDARSRSNGTIQGNVTYAAGKVGQGFQLGGNGDLSGNGDRVIVGNPANLRLQDFTIETWVKRSSSAILTNSPFPSSPNGTIFAYGQNGYAFFIDQNTNRLGLTNVGISLVSSNLSITDTNWHHVAVTKSGNQVVFYVDGAADTPIIYNTTFGFTTNAAIGARGDNNAQNAFFGAIDELAIYNRALTASEVQSIFNSGTIGKCKPLATLAPDNQVLWLAGDGDANDSAGGNNGTLSNGAGFAVGKVGQSLTFDGLSDQASVPHNQITVPHNENQNVGNQLTIEGWIKPTTNNNSNSLLQKRTDSNVGGYILEVVNSQTIGFYIFVGGTFHALIPANSITAGVWQHVAATYDGAFMRIYVNGIEIANQAQTGAIDSVTAPIIIGRNTVVNSSYQGGIDELGLYNRALTAAEIQSISNAGLAGKYKVQSTVPNGLTAWYAGDGNTNDLQGANNALLQNGATYGNGKVGQGFQFDGADDQITVPDNANQNGGSNLTIEAWINPTTLPHGGTIFQKRTSGNVGGYLLETTQPSGNGASNGLQFVIMIGGVYQTLNPAGILTTNVWQHVAATYDGAFMRIYVNGVEVGNKPQTGAIDAVNTPVVIGRNAVNNTAYQGGIDEISLFNRALTANEIRDIYYAGNGGKYKVATNPAVFNKTKTGEAEVTFGTSTNAGAVHLTPLDSALLPALPMGTNTGLNFDVSTTASFTNPQVCFNVPTFTPAQFVNLRVFHLESGVWQNRTGTGNVYPNLCTNGLISLSPFAINIVAPTAANASVSGRVLTFKGSGIRNVRVSLTTPGGKVFQTLTGSFGYYKFSVPAGQTYVLSVAAKQYTFANPTRIINLQDDLNGTDFVADDGGIRQAGIIPVREK